LVDPGILQNQGNSMPRPKRSSKVLDRAKRRIAAIKSISAALDLENSHTVDSFNTMIEATHNKLFDYNSSLSTVDAAQSALVEAEKKLMEVTEHILLSVAAKYGKDSDEYEIAGGIRRSDRQRPVRKTA
jgi:7-cyano-7-deazaguanine synthase in queuosine biosynthesis